MQDLGNTISELLRYVVRSEPSSKHCMTRGSGVLSVALGRIVISHREVLESKIDVMNLSHGMKETNIHFLFEVLKQTVRVMQSTETQLLLGKATKLSASEV